MLVFELSGPSLYTEFQLNIFTNDMADFSLFFGAKSSEVPSFILLPWQQLKI